MINDFDLVGKIDEIFNEEERISQERLEIIKENYGLIDNLIKKTFSKNEYVFYKEIEQIGVYITPPFLKKNKSFKEQRLKDIELSYIKNFIEEKYSLHENGYGVFTTFESFGSRLGIIFHKYKDKK